jgi:hypothetical protein
MRWLADQDRAETGPTDLVLARLQPRLGPLGAPTRLETKGNRPGEDRGRRNFFLSGVLVVRAPCRKPVLEMAFGFEKVRRVAPKVLREPETIDPLLERIFVHNIMGDQ